MNRTHRIGGDRIGAGSLGYTEVRNLNFSFFTYDDILGLDIPVNDMIIVSRFYAQTDLNGDRNGFFNRMWKV